MGAVRYSFGEAAASLWRGRRSAVLAVGTIAVALFVFGGFLTLLVNLERLAAEWGSAAEMSVYLSDEVTASERAAIEGALAPGAVVQDREYVSKQQALSRFKEMFADFGPSLEQLDDNPLPASYEVRVSAGAVNDGRLDSLGNALRGMPGVNDVRFDRQWLNRLASVIRMVRTVGVALSIVLTLAAALTVAAVVRLALFARRAEIEIMELVGAPTAYVRGPFVAEGVLEGGFGAVVALVALGALFLALKSSTLASLAAAGDVPLVRFLPVELCILLVIGGMIVGCVGGLVAAWNR